tara:strand:- start:3722 stop:3982 length:261 start_codon:yes stop_codon:yes gene_type:complete
MTYFVADTWICPGESYEAIALIRLTPEMASRAREIEEEIRQGNIDAYFRYGEIEGEQRIYKIPSIKDFRSRQLLPEIPPGATIYDI